MSRKINQLIKLEDLADTYSKIIGNYIDIKLNVATDVDPYRPQGIMLATRQPYKISNIKAEQLQIALRFYVCCETSTEYNEAIKTLTQLLGLNKGKFTSNEKEFNYFSFLDLQQPLGDPEVNSGKFFQTLELIGTCLITQCKGGAFIGNEIKTTLYLDPKTIINENGESVTEFSTIGEIPVVASSTAIVKEQESPQMSNSMVAQAINMAQVYTYSFTVLILKDAVGERLVKAIENILPIGLNEEIRIKKDYPAFTGEAFSSTKKVIMTSATMSENAGAFVVAELTFQDKLEIVELEEFEATVQISESLTVDDIKGEYTIDEDGTIKCYVGTIISVTKYGTKTSFEVVGGTYRRTSDAFVVSPVSFDVTVTDTVCTITSEYINTGGGTITV